MGTPPNKGSTFWIRPGATEFLGFHRDGFFLRQRLLSEVIVLFVPVLLHRDLAN